jgi:DNA polymerase-1
VNEIRELRSTFAKLRLEQLEVGSDGRNRTLVSAFRARTGRNQPSNTRSIFGSATWIRGLIKPGPERAVAYLDWSAQEFAIAAALSGDEAMLRAYATDPYLAMAVLAGRAPAWATKETHGAVRDVFKIVALAVQYGMQAESLAIGTGMTQCEAHELLLLLRESFRTFFAWSENSMSTAMLGMPLEPCFGWRTMASTTSKPTTFRNHPIQGAGAEMMRLACIFATEAGYSVWPVHDALLVETSIDDLDRTVAAVAEIMGRASEVVTGGLRIRVGVKMVRHPDRYMDQRGIGMREKVIGMLREDVGDFSHDVGDTTNSEMSESPT